MEKNLPLSLNKISLYHRYLLIHFQSNLEMCGMRTIHLAAFNTERLMAGNYRLVLSSVSILFMINLEESGLENKEIHYAQTLQI